MTTVVEQMIEKYNCQNSTDYKNALKEVVQEIALCGLSRSNFFQKAAFYGGTALRMFYGLNRFSEDMDFSLCEVDSEFKIDDYFSFVKNELASTGFEMNVERKDKSNVSDIQPAFIKGGTLIHLLKINPNPDVFSKISPTENIKIKFEIDINPPSDASYEIKYGLVPIPYAVKMYDEASLFAGKIHAVLCRGWKNRIKGRDFYDYVWYLSRNAKPNLKHLQKRLEQSGKWNSEETLTTEILKNLLLERFNTVDFELAKQDVLPFIKDVRSLEMWSTDFFKAITLANL